MKKSVISFTTTIAVLFALGACGSPEPTDPAQGEDEAGADESSEYPPAPEDPVEFAKFVVENVSTRGEQGAADFLNHYGSDWFQGEVSESANGIGDYVYGSDFASMYDQNCTIKGEPKVEKGTDHYREKTRPEPNTIISGDLTCKGSSPTQPADDKPEDPWFSVTMSPDHQIDDFRW